MLKAGALLYAMFLVITVSIISSSFVLVNHYNSKIAIASLKQEQLFKDVYSGINYALSAHQNISVNNLTTVDLFNDEKHQVELQKKTWGAFYCLTSSAKWRNKSVSKTALVGTNINTGNKVAIYLAEQNKPLSLTGKTSIEGDCYLPKSGVKRAYIEGKSFVGNKLINGLKNNSDKSLPTINEALITQNYNQFVIQNFNNDSIIDFELVVEQDSIINPFNNKTLVLYSPFSVVLSNKVIKGNVVIKSDRNIIIESSVNLDNAICYAKGIIVEEDTHINTQLFAQDSVLIGESCQFNYPSVIALIGKGNTSSERKIEIGENVNFKGSVFLYNEKYNRKNQAVVSIGKDSQIIGEVYSSELLELRGDVKGGVFCKSFTLKTSSSTYQNHLMDVSINRNALSEHFVGVALTEQVNQFKVIKWLN